jgi:hypothetical protein
MSKPLKVLIITALIGLCPVAGMTQSTNAIKEFFPDYVLVYPGWVATEQMQFVFSNHVTGDAYVCFNVTNTAFLTAADANRDTGDIRDLTFNLIKSFYTAFQNATNFNHGATGSVTGAPSQVSIGQTVRTVSGSDVRFVHTVESDVDLTGLGVTPEE